MEREVVGVSSTALCRLPARRGHALRPEHGRDAPRTDRLCHLVLFDLRFRANLSRQVTDDGEPAGPGMIALRRSAGWRLAAPPARARRCAVRAIPAATDSRPGVAHARDRARAIAAVRDAKRQADFVAVFMHWGKEGSECPTEEMRSLAKALSDAGADLITGTHAHLLLGNGWLGRTYVAYGLGNFLWWWNDAYSNDTGVLRITLRDKKIARTELVPAYISRDSGQPLPVTGAEADRIITKFTTLRGCTGLADAPS